MQRFSIQAVKGTNRIRVVDELRGVSEEVPLSEDIVAQIVGQSSGTLSFVVPKEVPSMKVCVYAT